MIIDSDERNSRILIMVIIVLLIMSLYIYADSGNVLVGIICGGIPLLFVFRQWMAIDRTIVMNKHGCEVIFLWYKKKYKWNELELKKIVYFKNAWGNRNQYIKGAIFYKKINSIFMELSR